MTCCKIYLIILALITCHVNANYEYERLKSLSHVIDVPQVPSQHNIYESVSSEILPHYYNSYESSDDRYRDRSTSSVLSERSPISVKKKLVENKNLKKMKIPSLMINKDYTAKYKQLLPNSEIAHCQEINVKLIGKEDKIRKDFMTCYKCEDPKTRSTYERCLHNNPPEESASANTERFIPVSSRYRRSNMENEKISYGKTNPYRFSDEYFTDAMYDVPAAYESRGERCDKVVKNSMICMICQDAKTNGKYEQCSYVKQPQEKAFAYIKSGIFEKPEERRNNNAENNRSNSYPLESSEGSNLEKKDWNPIAIKESREYSYPNEDHTERISIINQQDKVQDASSTACKQVQRDSKTCTVCKDPKIGGIYEKCIYNYQPSDKLYKYSKSKSFGYPDKISTDSTRDLNETQTSEKSKRFDYPQSSDSTHDYLDKSKHSIYPWRSEKAIESEQVASDLDSTSRDSPNYSSDYSSSKGSSNYQPLVTGEDTEFYEDQATPSLKSVSAHYSENIDADHCKKFQKDSMTCTVCKNPKTGNDFEQCSYSYQPSDKVFSYSKSSSFGNSRENDKYQQIPHEDKQASDSSEIAKDSYNVPIGEEGYEASRTTDEAKDDSKDAVEGKKEGVDAGYLDTAKKKAEIEEFMQNFRKKDRSKCRKIMRDKMTCYRCVDEENVQKEECVFVTGQEPDQLAFREIKEFQIDPASHARVHERSSSTKTRERITDPLEPSASASRNSYVKLEKPDNDYPDEMQHTAEETKEAEPYDYTSETRSRYDKVLGLTLPAYMFATSEHEVAFDEVVASSHDQR
ncbi:uncharacterized protein LOC126848731 [Cataglyphis hispanica]|uniref:uncharacterized protein LOC126848731 n=1 Tax=Cataglyphis hispanica TaxID=1086592 RepID=UPI0021800A39|nr:uncharacterized protein LOC126848731 [Cataglyphis hispanica]